MITTDTLYDLARRFVLRTGETIVWTKAFPDGPTIDIETEDRAYALTVTRGLLRAEHTPWVAAVVQATREDLDLCDRPPPQLFLARRDGGTVRLGAPDDVAALGRLLHTGKLDEVTYAELIVESQWPGGWRRRLVTDPDTWRAAHPAPARLPTVPRPVLHHTAGTARMTFAASREYAEAPGARGVLDVALWTVVAPAGGPATWQHHLIAEAVPLAAPW